MEPNISDQQPLAGLEFEHLARGETAIRAYYGLDRQSAYTGSAFEAFGENPPDSVTSDDIVATTLLSIRVGTLRKGISGWAPQHILKISEFAGAVRDELQHLPAGVDLHELSEVDALRLVGWESEDSPAYRLFQLLRHNLGVAHSPGRVAVYKLLARKRPRLLAVRDTVVERAVGHQTPHTWWMPWWHSLTSTNGIIERLEEIRNQVPSQLRPSILRTADIVLWMRARS